MTITALLPEHWSTVKTIYEQGISTGQATFQTTAPSWEESTYRVPSGMFYCPSLESEVVQFEDLSIPEIDQYSASKLIPYLFHCSSASAFR